MIRITNNIAQQWSKDSPAQEEARNRQASMLYVGIICRVHNLHGQGVLHVNARLSDIELCCSYWASRRQRQTVQVPVELSECLVWEPNPLSAAGFRKVSEKSVKKQLTPPQPHGRTQQKTNPHSAAGPRPRRQTPEFMTLQQPNLAKVREFTGRWPLQPLPRATRLH